MTAGFDVLLVDDDDAVLDSLGELLEAHGYAVRVAESGAEAIQILQSQRPRLVISDVRMPRMSGMDLVQRIRSEPGLEKVPVVMISGVERAREAASADAWMEKPLHVPELLRVMRSLGGPELNRTIQ